VSSEIVANNAGVSVQETGEVTSRDEFSQLFGKEEKE
jgi:hypothetical protein